MIMLSLITACGGSSSGGDEGGGGGGSSSTLFGVDILTDQLLTIATSTGAGTAIGGTAIVPDIEGLARDTNTGTLYGSDLENLYTINAAIGAAALIGSFDSSNPIANDVRALAFDPNTNTLYGIGSEEAPAGPTPKRMLLSIDTTTGAGTVIGETGIVLFPATGLAFDPNTDTLYALFDGLGSTLYVINTMTAVATRVGLVGSGGAVLTGLAFDPATNTLYGSRSDNSLVIINTADGGMTVVGAFNFGGVNGLAP